MTSSEIVTAHAPDGASVEFVLVGTVNRAIRLGVLSDTHVPEAAPQIFPEVAAVISSSDLILHSGDVHDVAVLDQLHDRVPVLAARGNGDDGSSGRPPQPEDDRLAPSWLIEVRGVCIGLVHDGWFSEGVDEPRFERACRRLFGRRPDVIVSGHTHVEHVHVDHGTLCLNPGSAMLPRNRTARLGTVGELLVRDRDVRAVIGQVTPHGLEELAAVTVERPATGAVAP